MPDMTDAESSGYESLLDYLKSSRAFDFRSYKKPSLMRRIQRRMSVVGIASFEEYQRYLETQPEEFIQLFNTVLINVTTFFRDGIPWDFLSQNIVPQLLEQKRQFDSIRIWSAGCATGEEAYTVAIVLAEALGHEEFRNRVKIYATDIDEDALAVARLGTFSAKDIASVPAPLLERYFEKTTAGYSFRKELRRAIIFGKHDLLQDAPISRVDILVCRNTLMYFNATAQARILARLHFALTDGGFLFLGRAETLLAHSSTFRPVEIKHRVFAKIPGPRMGPRLQLVEDVIATGAPAVRHDDIRDIAFNGSGVAQIVIDRGGEMILANDAARQLFSISPRDIGRPFRDLELSYRPIELRSLIEQAYVEQRAITVSSVEHRRGDLDGVWLDAQIIPLARRNGEVGGVSLIFTDVTLTKRLQYALERANLELEGAYEQLQSTNEELETTNEELHSTVEELETTNEELQASNEELETMNEELQSTNDELQTVNDVARAYTTDLDIANDFLESIFTALGHRVIVVDREGTVVFWNTGAEELWGVKSHDAMHAHLGSLDIGLPVEDLDDAIGAVISGESARKELTVHAMNRRGKPLNLKVSLAPLLSRDARGIAGVIILTDDSRNEVSEAARQGPKRA